MKKILSAVSVIIIMVACTTAKLAQQSEVVDSPARTVATSSFNNCQDYTASRGQDKQEILFNKHLREVHNWIANTHPQSSDVPMTALEVKNTLSVIADPLNRKTYISDFIGSYFKYGIYDAQAVAATLTFLAPDSSQATKLPADVLLPDGVPQAVTILEILAPHVTNSFGYPSLAPTFTRSCELFQQPEVKKVHALGSFAKGKMVVYPHLKALSEHDEIIADNEVENPWTGLLGSDGNQEGIPLLLRFSIANPVAHQLTIQGKSLLLEFIPGLGMKFLLDGHRSVDLVAMESLAGQGSDHNFFKYEFSPDFSAHAPPSFNTATGDDKAEIEKRYGSNPVNSTVMNLVGERFAQVIPMAVKGITEADIHPHSDLGPHPFVIAIETLAQWNKNGSAVKENSERRPWRLVFKPALDNISDDARRAKIVDSTAHVLGNPKTDFRSKLGHLEPGDRLYYVIGETKSKKRYILGEIVLDSYVTPSVFADRMYFVQHQLDLGRSQKPFTVVEPSL